MENPKNQIIAALKEANNVLVTVSTNPSVDQLSACIGFTLLLNKLNKHGTAVFSGDIPSTLEFLQPEETLEKTTDSLRDFIISLDKSKADKLRYKVEDKMVKIFITPYRSSISQDDLIFSQGDFNVDVVVALGVHERNDIDQAIVAHGRILHDATVVSINTNDAGALGSINWSDPQASSLSEMVVGIGQELKKDALDAQMATAFLTGIVAETDRFSNEKTTSATMNISAQLMSAGANQQLVATKLQEPVQAPEPEPQDEASQTPEENNPEPEATVEPTQDEVQTDEPSAQADNDGALHIDHPEPEERPNEDINLPPLGGEAPADEEQAEPANDEDNKSEDSTRMIMSPPEHMGRLTANDEPEGLDPSTDPLSQPNDKTGPMLSHGSRVPTSEEPQQPAAEPEQQSEQPAEQPAPVEEAPEEQGQPETAAPETPDEPEPTLDDLEKAVDSPHLAAQQPPSEGDAREALQKAMDSDDSLEPIAALNAQPVNLDLGHESESQEQDSAGEAQPEKAEEQAKSDTLGEDDGISKEIHIDPATGEIKLPENLVPPKDLPPDSTGSQNGDASAPPPVPPPMMPPATPPEEDGDQPLPPPAP